MEMFLKYTQTGANERELGMQMQTQHGDGK